MEQYGLKFILPTGESKVFAELPISIGRGEQNDLVLQDETVSSSHARVYFDDRLRSVCIVDLGSLNGIYLDGLPSLRNVLYDDAKIRFGKVELTFRDTGYLHPD